jgi:hypothetical protein
MFLLFTLLSTCFAGHNLDNISRGDTGVTWYDNPAFAYECTGFNLFGYSELCNEWTTVLWQKRVHDYLTPLGVDLALHHTVRHCMHGLSHSKCIELLDGLLLNGADPCSTRQLITPYELYLRQKLFPKFDILNRLTC